MPFRGGGVHIVARCTPYLNRSVTFSTYSDTRTLAQSRAPGVLASRQAPIGQLVPAHKQR